MKCDTDPSQFIFTVDKGIPITLDRAIYRLPNHDATLDPQTRSSLIGLYLLMGSSKCNTHNKAL